MSAYSLRDAFPFHLYPYDPNFPNGFSLIPPDKGRVSDPAYKEVSEKMVIACADVVLIVDNGELPPTEVVLMVRNQRPAKGLRWICGGRLLFQHVDPRASLAHVAMGEIKLPISPERLKTLMLSLYAWGDTDMGDGPGRNLGITFGCMISRAELAQIKLNGEYIPGSFHLATFDNIKSGVEAGKDHPMLLDLCKVISRQLEYR